MKLCISNIAWRAEEEAQVARLLEAQGVAHIELAPLRAVTTPWAPDREEATRCRAFWAQHGMQIHALQALLFGRDGLALFEAPEARARMLDHLRGVLQLAQWLGAQRLVFGSPGQRRRNGLSVTDAGQIAADFFGQVGALAQQHGTQVCIEPNPEAYGCDFVTTAAQGEALVRAVHHPGFGLHLDAAGMHLAGDDGPQAVCRGIDVLGHFHISAPQLGHVDRSVPIDYAALLAALGQVGYAGCVSIEMRAEPQRSNLGGVAEAVGYMQQLLAVTREPETHPPRP